MELAADTAERDPQLRRLGALCQELSAAFYRERGSRVAAKLGARPPPSPASVCHAFKAGALAEFRQDWSTALRLYKVAFDLLQALQQQGGAAAAAAAASLVSGPAAGVGGSGPYGAGGGAGLHSAAAPPAAVSTLATGWHVAWERLCAREWLHLKLCTLLLHTCPTAADAAAQLRAHLAETKRPPPDWPLIARPAYWGWVVRQYRAFGELLQARMRLVSRPRSGFCAATLSAASAEEPPSCLFCVQARLPSTQAGGAAPPPRELQPGFYYYAAANAGVQRRQARASAGTFVFRLFLKMAGSPQSPSRLTS